MDYHEPITITLTRNDLYGLLGACARDVATQEKRLAKLTEGSAAWHDASLYLRSSEECRVMIGNILHPSR